VLLRQKFLVRQVIDRIKALGAVSVRTMSGIEETIKFPLPKGLKIDGTGQAADDGEYLLSI
jgi:4-hydroxy-3-methylbut-2-enyl diphosphate reductase